MLYSLHAASILHTNMLLDIRIAREAGYDGLEVWIPKLERFLDAGHKIEELITALGPLRCTMMSPLYGIERQEPEARAELRRRCARMSAVAKAIGCPALQAIALDGLKAPWPEMRTTIAQFLAELADIAAPFGVRLGLEPVAVAPMRTLAQALEVMDAAARPNIGIVIDTFHMWAGGTPWEQVAALDARSIVCAHIGDATKPRGKEFTDDDRAAFPGDGILPLREGVAAIQATGFDGAWSVEVWSPYHWELDPAMTASELKRRAAALVE